MTEPKKKKKKERAAESQESPPAAPPSGGDPLGTKVIAATAGIVIVIGVVAWATTSRPSDRARDEAQEDIRAEAIEEGAREERRAARDRDEEGAEAPAARPGDRPAPPDVAGPPPGTERTVTGLASRVLRPGTGTRHPTGTSRVTVHYTGWTTDGRMFDSSVTRGEPATFPLDRVIPGWTEGVQLMVEGEQRRFWIPEELAYRGRPGAPAGMLVFDVELIRIED